jgi:hypothetical protein
MIHNCFTYSLLMRSNQRLTFLLFRRRLEVCIYSYNSLSIFIISDSKYLLFTSWNKWKFNNINFLNFFTINLLLYFLIPLTFIVILLHWSKFTIIINNIRHTLSLFIDRILNLLIFLLYYLVYLLCIDKLLICRLFLLMSIWRIKTSCQFLYLILLIFIQEDTIIANDLNSWRIVHFSFV